MQSALPSADSYQVFSTYARARNGRIPSQLEALRGYVPLTHIEHISPTALLMIVADNDLVTQTDLALNAYAEALEPKSLHILPGGHFDVYAGEHFEPNVEAQASFLRRHLS
ncbi:hypothetical protein BDV24DRAFT_156299 [Aspergillus arachidicola]|uniref:Uncharacterized protein n=1 Tax=Aspergillus arachidicola TaxID=656916 RepID=A0A5N6XPE8_9EURO|nr:hypothetical protein BDV24DRAFT_156299 [Aspergillus arachidicola]